MAAARAAAVPQLTLEGAAKAPGAQGGYSEIAPLSTSVTAYAEIVNKQTLRPASLAKEWPREPTLLRPEVAGAAVSIPVSIPDPLCSISEKDEQNGLNEDCSERILRKHRRYKSHWTSKQMKPRRNSGSALPGPSALFRWDELCSWRGPSSRRKCDGTGFTGTEDGAWRRPSSPVWTTQRSGSGRPWGPCLGQVGVHPML